MPQALPALRKVKVKAFTAALFLLALESAAAEDWYLSNAAGMTLEPLYSRFIALRERYCVSIDEASEVELPAILLPYYDSAFRIELHTLYENGVQTRRQWIFKDSAGTTRLASAFDEPAPSGFIEVYNADYLISEERQFAEDGSETFSGYFYNGKTLIRVETSVRAAPAEDSELSPLTLLTTDYYRYTRAASLRAVERVYHTVAESEVSGTGAVSGTSISGTGASGSGTSVSGTGTSGTSAVSGTSLGTSASGTSTSGTGTGAVSGTSAMSGTGTSGTDTVSGTSTVSDTGISGSGASGAGTVSGAGAVSDTGISGSGASGTGTVSGTGISGTSASGTGAVSGTGISGTSISGTGTSGTGAVSGTRDRKSVV
jgi:hypothetical protein